MVHTKTLLEITTLILNKKEATDKKKTEAETTYAQAQRNARRNADGSIDMTDLSIVAAKAVLDYAEERQEKLKLIIKRYRE